MLVLMLMSAAAPSFVCTDAFCMFSLTFWTLFEFARHVFVPLAATAGPTMTIIEKASSFHQLSQDCRFQTGLDVKLIVINQSSFDETEAGWDRRAYGEGIGI